MPRQRLDSGSTEQTPQSPGARAQISANTGAAGSDKRARRRAPNRKKALELHAGQAGSVVDKFYGSGKYHPQPISYGERVKWVPVAAEYAKRSGKSLWAQPDMHLALLQYNIAPPDSTDNSIEARRQRGPAGPPERTIPPRIAPQRPTRNARAPYLQHPHVGNGTDWGILGDVVHGVESGTRPVYTPVASAIIGGTQYALNRARGTTTSSAAPPGIQAIGAVSDVAKPVEGATQDIQDWQAKYDSRFTQFHVPNVHIALPSDPLTGTALAAAKGDQGAKAQLEDLRKQNKLRNWLPAETRAALRKQAAKNGWTASEIAKADDAALIERGLNYQPSLGRRLARGLATDLGTQIAFIPGMAAIGLAGLDSAQKGDITPLAKVVDQSFVQPVVQTVKHPVDSLIDHPLNTATLVMAAVHGGGKVAGKAVRLKPGDRMVNTPAIGGGSVRLGAKSTNLAIRAAQKIQEAAIDPSRLQTSRIPPARSVGNVLAKGAEKRQGKAVGREANYQHRVLTHAEERKISNLTKHAKRALNKLDENQRKALFWTINYGTTPHEMAAMHLELARKAMEAGDAALATRQHVQANAYLSLDRAYKTIAGGGRDTAKADAAIAALRELQPGVDKALEDVGVAPIDLGQQASLAHPGRMDAAVTPVRDAANAQVSDLTQQISDARAAAIRSVTPFREAARRTLRTGNRQQRAIDQAKYSDLRAAHARSIVEERRATADLERAALSTGRSRTFTRHSNIDHVEFRQASTGTVNVPGARTVGKNTWLLRPNLKLRAAGKEFKVIAGSGDRPLIETYATLDEAARAARALDGIDLNIRERSADLKGTIKSERAKERGKLAKPVSAGRAEIANILKQARGVQRDLASGDIAARKESVAAATTARRLAFKEYKAAVSAHVKSGSKETRAAMRDAEHAFTKAYSEEMKARGKNYPHASDAAAGMRDEVASLAKQVDEYRAAIHTGKAGDGAPAAVAAAAGARAAYLKRMAEISKRYDPTGPLVADARDALLATDPIIGAAATTGSGSLVRALSDALAPAERSRLEAARQRAQDATAKARKTAADLADFQARSIDERTMNSLVEDYRSRHAQGMDHAAQLRQAISGRTAPESIATAEMKRYVDLIEQRDAARVHGKEDVANARQSEIDQILADNPRAAFVFTPHQHGADLGGIAPGKARAAVDITTDTVPRFANPRTDALYRRGEVNLSAHSPIQAIDQAHTLKAIIDVGQRIWSDPQWSREAKAGDIIDKKHEVLVQVGGPKNVKRSFTNAAHDRMVASVQDVLDATDTRLSPEQIADLYTKQIIEPDSLVESGMVTVDPDTGVYRIKNGGELRIVKRAAVDAVVAYQKQRSGGRFGTSRPVRVAAKTSRIVRRSMLRSSIGTVTRNWQGIPQLALRGPVLTARAARQGMKGAIGKPVPIEWQVPDHILDKGLTGGDPYKAVGSKVAGFAIDVNGVRVMPIKPVAAYMDGLGTLNMVGEDATRALIYLGEAHKLARGDAMNAVERIANHFGYANDAFKNVLDDLKNQRDPRWVDLAKEVDRLAGDMTKVGQFDAPASMVLAFHRWYAHMLKLTLWTMPVRHPFRAYLIQSVSRAGEEYLKEHGVAPSFLMDSVIIASFILPKMGLNHAEELGWWAIGTQGGNVYATPASLLPLDKNGDVSVMAGAAGMLQPQYNAALIAASGNDPAGEIQGRDMLDQYGNVIHPGTTQAFAAAANTAMRSFPFVNILAPQTGMSPESLPWDQHRRRYTTPDGKTLPPEFAPPLIGDAGVNPYGDLTSTIMALARYAGFSPRLIPVQGNRTNIQHVKTVKAAKTKFSQEIHSRARSDGKG